MIFHLPRRAIGAVFLLLTTVSPCLGTGAATTEITEKQLAAANEAAGVNLGASTASVQQVRALFEGVLASARGSLRIRAANDYGVYLLRNGQSRDAVKVFAAVESQAAEEKQLDAATRARYYYNYGKALDATHQALDASDKYREAVRLDPRFDAALEAARLNLKQLGSFGDLPSLGAGLFNRLAMGALIGGAVGGVSGARLGLSTTSPRLYAGLELCRILLSRGDIAAAADLLSSLAEPASRSSLGATRYLDSLVVFLTKSRTVPADFNLMWDPVIAKLAPLSKPVSVKVDDLRTIYRDDLPLVLNPEGANALFRTWEQDPYRSRLSALLKAVGDTYADQEQYLPAFRRYALAFDLDTSNIDAALYMANLLLSSPAAVDPRGEVLNDWIGAIFPSSSENPIYRGDDWPDILRFHTILAAILERQGRLGPPTTAWTASFHWEKAIRAETIVAERFPDQSRPSPLLHEKLAAFYASSGRSQTAFGLYLNASYEYFSLDESNRARDLLKTATPLQHAASRDQLASFKLAQDLSNLTLDQERPFVGSIQAAGKQRFYKGYAESKTFVRDAAKLISSGKVQSVHRGTPGGAALGCAGPPGGCFDVSVLPGGPDADRSGAKAAVIQGLMDPDAVRRADLLQDSAQLRERLASGHTLCQILHSPPGSRPFD
jgi:tetratricopeptide (TPR) repeat protein